MPVPRNQWNRNGSTGLIKFGPIRRNRPSSPSGILPCNFRSKQVVSASTGAKFPARNVLPLRCYCLSRRTLRRICRASAILKRIDFGLPALPSKCPQMVPITVSAAVSIICRETLRASHFLSTSPRIARDLSFSSYCSSARRESVR